jgi:5-methylcytosine-specific restriction endonuclease McrA/transposase
MPHWKRYTKEETQQVHAMLDQGLSEKEIGKGLGRTETAIKVYKNKTNYMPKCADCGQKFKATQHTSRCKDCRTKRRISKRSTMVRKYEPQIGKSRWTAERTQQLHKLLDQNLSIEEVAERLSRTVPSVRVQRRKSNYFPICPLCKQRFKFGRPKYCAACLLKVPKIIKRSCTKQPKKKIKEKRRVWGAQEEVQHLTSLLDQGYSVEKIAEELNCTENAVRTRKVKINYCPVCLECKQQRCKSRRNKRCPTCTEKREVRVFKESKQREYDNARFGGNRKHALKRDLYRCRMCNKNEEEATLHVHHRDLNKENNMLKNLMTLCEVCHGKLHAEITIALGGW